VLHETQPIQLQRCTVQRWIFSHTFVKTDHGSLKGDKGEEQLSNPMADPTDGGTHCRLTVIHSQQRSALARNTCKYFVLITKCISSHLSALPALAYHNEFGGEATVGWCPVCGRHVKSSKATEDKIPAPRDFGNE